MKQAVTIVVHCLFFTITLVDLQASQGSFKKKRIEQKLKISGSSGQFLKKVLLFQQDFLNNRMHGDKNLALCLPVIRSGMQINDSIAKKNEINAQDIDQLFDVAAQANKMLYIQEFKINCELQIQVWRAWWLYLKQSLNQAKLLGFESDRLWLEQQITNFDNLKQSHDQQSVVLIRCANVCSQMMHQFDGVMVTEYDLFVLVNIMIALVALQC